MDGAGEDARPGGGRVLGEFLVLAVVWGASFLFIKVALQGLSPTQVVLGRLTTGAITLGLVCLLTRRRLPTAPRVIGHLVVVGLLSCVVPFLLFSWAEQRIGSGLASIYNATTPLMTGVLTLVALRSERLTPRKALGLAVGFAGVLVVLGPWRGVGAGALLGQLACLGATFCYGLVFVYLRRFVTPLHLSSLAVATVQVGTAAAILLLAAPFVATTPVTLSWPVVASVVALGALGTGLAYVWNTDVVAHWGATNASTVTYLTPVVGVALGVLLLGEPFAWNEPVGAALVVLGIAVNQGRLRLPESRPRTVAEPPPTNAEGL